MIEFNTNLLKSVLQIFIQLLTVIANNLKVGE